eukprot:CAMPEP_0181250994 /NCGR_PEP_ID=MMETSP1096-20121128/46626_1 /TAXON_ID=156174 ORGANISM="Chrysochromulina ericina, Strain CCMP281" /NCGR_SAMPLE_ID=MMETSP1096 /ASSEMBLY_ACC=CAM_ASM_000453 /LENGTH=142 /DNA_ID=CAMNT_0023348519 /DNA_START=201 /DNA_END=630 /DNA_ORIENTATION=-
MHAALLESEAGSWVEQCRLALVTAGDLPPPTGHRKLCNVELASMAKHAADQFRQRRILPIAQGQNVHQQASEGNGQTAESPRCSRWKSPSGQAVRKAMQHGAVDAERRTIVAVSGRSKPPAFAAPPAHIRQRSSRCRQPPRT